MESLQNFEKKYRRLRRLIRSRYLNPDNMINELFRILAEYSQDVVFMVDARGVIMLANFAATRVSGYQRDEMVGEHFRMFLTLDDLSEGFKIFYRTLRGEATEATKLRIRKKDGSTTILELSGTPVIKNGRFIGGLAIARDIGERMMKESQERIREQTFLRLLEDSEARHREIETLKGELAELRNRTKRA